MYYLYCFYQVAAVNLETETLIFNSGSIGEIKAWKWSDLKRKEAKPVWTYYIPQG